jgi:hypothetical protein
MPILKIKPLTERLLDSAPEAGNGLHRWLIKGARMCQLSGVNPDRAFDLIAATVVARGGEIIPHSIRQAIEKAYSQPFTGGTYQRKSKWPEPDLELIEQITEAIDREPNQLSKLENLSPDPLSLTTQEIVSRLFAAGSWICPGVINTATDAYQLEKIMPSLNRHAFIVPNPMKGKTGSTQDGRESGRCLDNVKERRFLVCEFDFAETNRKGEPTIWTALVKQWRLRGSTPQNAMAAIIMRMMSVAPLVLVTFSGSKSLHAWFWCQGEREEPGSGLQRFMVNAARLGADPATFTPSQFVRMPAATRIDTGVRQTVHFLDFKHVRSTDGQQDFGAN